MPCSKRKNGITLTESFKRADEWLIKRKSKKRKRNTRTKAGGKKTKKDPDTQVFRQISRAV